MPSRDRDETPKKKKKKLAYAPADAAMLKSIQILGIVIAVELAVLVVLQLVFVLGSSGMQETTTEMLALSRDVNASTTKSMGKMESLMSGVTPMDVQAIVNDTRRAVAGASDILGSVAESGNVTALVDGVRHVVLSINVTSLTAILSDSSSIAHLVDMVLSSVNVKAIALRIAEIVSLMDPTVVQSMLCSKLCARPRDRTYLVGPLQRTVLWGRACTHSLSVRWDRRLAKVLIT